VRDDGKSFEVRSQKDEVCFFVVSVDVAATVCCVIVIVVSCFVCCLEFGFFSFLAF